MSSNTTSQSDSDPGNNNSSNPTNLSPKKATPDEEINGLSTELSAVQSTQSQVAQTQTEIATVQNEISSELENIRVNQNSTSDIPIPAIFAN